MNDSRGYISLYRSIQNHWLYGEDEPFSYFQAWVDLIMLAKYKDEEFFYRGRSVNGKRGNVYKSMASLAKKWNWSRDKVSLFLKALEKERMVVLDTTRHLTVIRIVNYAKYQDGLAFGGNENGQTTGSPSGDTSGRWAENSPSGSLFGSPFDSTFDSKSGSELDTSNKNNKRNKDNKIYSDTELNISATADPDEDSTSTGEDDDEDDDGAAFYRMMAEQYGPEVK